MSMLFACFLGTRERRDSSAISEASEFSANGLKNTDSSSQLEVVYVELLRRDDQPLGLVLKGGTDKGIPVQVAELRSGGVAEQSGALQIGDHIQSINGTVTDHLTNIEATSLLETAGNVVNLEIAFDALPDGSQKLDDGMELKTAFVTLSNEELSNPGFVISGGRLDNRPITVSHVKPGSYPYKKGVLRVGDRILQMNGRDMRNASQTDFADTLKSCSSSTFTLQIEYDVTTHEELEERVGPFMVELQKPHGASLGISLSAEPGSPVYISRVRDAGIADRSGALHVGDNLLSINGQQLEGRSVQEARHMLAHSDINVTLEIMPSNNLSERPGGISRTEDGLSDTSSRISHSVVPSEYERKQPSRLSLISNFSSSHPIKTHPETMIVKIRADDCGFGMGLEGGSTEFGDSPICVSSIVPNGPAERLGQLLVGDRVIGINEQKLMGETLQQAYKLIQEGDNVLTLEVEFDVQDPPLHSSQTNEFTLHRLNNLQWGITLRGNHNKLWIASLVKGGIASRKGCFQPGDILVAVNGESVVEMFPKDVLDLINKSGDLLSITIRRETINNFASKRSQQAKNTEDVIYSVELERGSQSLGISLHGSERPGQPIIISHIKEGGVAHRTRALRVGDRVLAINGESLFSKSLDDAVTILQTAGAKVTLKISKGVVSRRRQRNKPGSSGKNYRNQRYRFNKPLYHGRVSSRISHTSDSELSTYEYMPEERPSSIMRHSPRGSEPVRRSARYNDPSTVGGVGIPGRYSPNNKQRYSPNSKGRNSPNKDKTSTIKNGSIPSGLPVGELSGLRTKKRPSFTETTDDDETLYDDDIVRPRRNYIGGYPSYTGENGTVGTDWNQMHSSRLLKNSGSLSRDRKKPPLDRSSPVGKRSPDNPKVERRIVLNHQTEEAILKQLEDTLLKSKTFVDKLTELANQSGSSDPDSDSEPIKERLRPHLKQQLLKHVREIMIPQQMDLIDVKLVRSSHSAGFGLSLSDGLLERGVYVNQIQPGGPADIAGLCRYDKIVRFNDEMVKDDDCCKVKPLFSQAGEEVLLTVARNPLASNNGAAAHSTASPMLLDNREPVDIEIEENEQYH